VSLGFYKTLFSAPGTSTSSEIPRTSWNGIDWWINSFSIGLDNDIEDIRNDVWKIGYYNPILIK
jgi:methionine-gamma-lyase